MTSKAIGPTSSTSCSGTKKSHEREAGERQGESDEDRRERQQMGNLVLLHGHGKDQQATHGKARPDRVDSSADADRSDRPHCLPDSESQWRLLRHQHLIHRHRRGHASGLRFSDLPSAGRARPQR